MRDYMAIGEYGEYGKVRYKCVDADNLTDEQGCAMCEVPKDLCGKLYCHRSQRPDKKSVYFKRLGTVHRQKKLNNNKAQ